MPHSKYLKTCIRLDKIHTRSLKTSYKGLLPHEKSLVKKVEQKEQLGKDLDWLWKQARYDEKGKVIQESMDWEAFHRIDKMIERLIKSIAFLEKKYGINEREVMNKFGMLNSARFYGGSY
jgi:hypothetical protein